MPRDAPGTGQEASRNGASPGQQSDELYRRMVSEVKDYAIFMLDPDGHVATWNEGAERIKGYIEQEILGDHFSRFYLEADVQAGKPSAALEIATREGRVEDEGWRLRKDGSRFWANVVITAVPDDRGEVIGFTKVTRDLTERRAAETAIEAYARQLQRSNEEWEQFAYVVSHDLQEPIRMIVSYLQLLEDREGDRLDEASHEYMGFALEGAHRIRQLIRGLLEFAKVDTVGRGFEQVDLEKVLQETLDTLQLRIEEEDAEITHDPLPTVHGDPIQIGQLFQNLIHNALKFRRENVPPRIHIGAEPRETYHEITVADNGVGFAPDQAERVFGIFQRLNERGAYPGEGIGLAVCKRVVNRHGGKIWPTQGDRPGVTFHFTLPDPETGRADHRQPPAPTPDEIGPIGPPRHPDLPP